MLVEELVEELDSELFSELLDSSASEHPANIPRHRRLAANRAVKLFHDFFIGILLSLCKFHVWSWNSEVDVSVVWVHISNIRKKLAQLQAPAEIRFLRGAGYVLEVRE